MIGVALKGLAGRKLRALLTALAVVLTPKIAPTPLLLIAAPIHGVGEKLNRGFAKAAGESATLWEIPESTHVGGLTARPEEYERRVVGFFNEALL
jgi:hypothetical protein